MTNDSDRDGHGRGVRPGALKSLENTPQKIPYQRLHQRLESWAHRRPAHVRATAENIAGNLKIYADRPWPPGLATALAEQVEKLSD